MVSRARATRGLRRPSLNTRSEGQPGTPYQEKILPCSREIVPLTHDAASNGLKLGSAPRRTEPFSVQAWQWYEKAAAQGDAMGQFALGLVYAEGRGVLQEYVHPISGLTS